MAAPPSEEETLLLKQRVFEYARQGKVHDLCSTLSSLSPALVEEVLHYYTKKLEQGRYLKGTPLFIAATEGHFEVVQLLVENFSVDPDQIVDTERLYGTALMCASQGGHLDIVKFLLTKGCAVNIQTRQKTTAVQVACQRNHLEVVKFLVESGACIHNDDKDGDSCLMEACRKGGEELVEYLLEKGANINKASKDGFTALHYAARCNCVKLVKILLKTGATISKNSWGISPLNEAAVRGSRDVVSFFVQSSYVGRKEKIDSLELLGAQMVGMYTASFEYLRQAMELRYEDPSEVIPKPCSRLLAQNSLMESRTLEELEARRLDTDLLYLECLTIALRILGLTSPDSVHYCLAYLWHYAGDEVLTNSAHVLQITEIFEIDHTLNNEFVGYICYALSGMLKRGQFPRFTSVCKILELSLDILRQIKPACVQNSGSSDFAPLCLVCISVGLEVAKDQEDMDLLQKLTESLVQLQPLIYRSESVLHSALRDDWRFGVCRVPVEDLHVDSFVSFLLQCGSDVNAMDRYRNRPLHILAGLPQECFDAETLRNLTHSLVEAGTPVAVLNGEGKTPLDIAATEEMADILHEFYPLSLLSLAASAVVKHRVPYTGQVPEMVEDFLQRH